MLAVDFAQTRLDGGAQVEVVAAGATGELVLDARRFKLLFDIERVAQRGVVAQRVALAVAARRQPPQRGVVGGALERQLDLLPCLGAAPRLQQGVDARQPQRVVGRELLQRLLVARQRAVKVGRSALDVARRFGAEL